MLEIYRTKNRDLHKKVEVLLERKSGKKFNIERNENGKPYAYGNPLYFSISHSASHAVIALCDKPVGIDFEYCGKDGGHKSYTHVLNRFTEREKNFINGEHFRFLLNWTAKEAYIKMIGGTLAHYLKRLEYFDGSLCVDGKNADCGCYASDCNDGVYAVCAEGYTKERLSRCPVKLFRLKNGERI